MKFFYALVILFFLNNCSFDNKSGIWKNENSISNNVNNSVFEDFKKISSSRERYNENIPIKQEFIFKLEKPKKNNSWPDFYYNKNNSTVSSLCYAMRKIIIVWSCHFLLLPV